VVGPLSFKVIEDFSSSVDVPFVKGLGISQKYARRGLRAGLAGGNGGGFGWPGSLMGVGKSRAPGGRVTHVDIVCEIFGCGILEPDHRWLRLGLRYLRDTGYFSNITRKGGKTVLGKDSSLWV
jgi:hypothetical protein